MDALLTWTLSAIREEGASASWLEERRYDWVPLAGEVIPRILEGAPVIIATDTPRSWFGRYILSAVNRSGRNRPLLPFVAIEGILPEFFLWQSESELELVQEMLNMALPNHFFWYIGRGDDARARLAKRRDDTFLWLIDEEAPNSFYLRSADEQLDNKLLTLYRLFEKSLEAALFGEIGV
ncbi:MAG: HobA family DNA replication regulator [Campylobacterales bacterium]